MIDFCISFFQQQTYGQWQIVFWILTATYIFGGLTFLIFGTGELLPWNSPKVTNNKPEQIENGREETIPLQNGSGNGKV